MSKLLFKCIEIQGNNISFPVGLTRLSWSAVDGAESGLFLCILKYTQMKITSQQARDVGTSQTHEAQAGTLDPVMTQSVQYIGRRA